MDDYPFFCNWQDAPGCLYPLLSMEIYFFAVGGAIRKLCRFFIPGFFLALPIILYVSDQLLFFSVFFSMPILCRI